MLFTALLTPNTFATTIDAALLKTIGGKKAIVPPNDECLGAINVPINVYNTCTNIVSGTTENATASIVNSLDFDPEVFDDVWFSFVATESSIKMILSNLQGADQALYHSLWTGDCVNNMTKIPNSNNSSNTSVFKNLNVGQTYYLRIYSFLYINGPITFDVCLATLPPAPINNECSGAIAVNVNNDLNCTIVTDGNFVSATPSIVITGDCFGYQYEDVWYSFVATNSIHKINLLDIQHATGDLFLSLWTGDCTNLSLVQNSCSDFNYANVSGLIVGQNYYIRVHTNSTSLENTTTFKICVSTINSPPINDEYSGAVLLSASYDLSCTNISSATLNGATATLLEVTDCSGSEDDDVWFKFKATKNIHQIVFSNIQGTTSGLNYSLWRDDASSLLWVPYSCTNTNSYIIGGLTIGEFYYLRVYSKSEMSETTTFDICIRSVEPPVNDECINAIPLVINENNLLTNYSEGTVKGATTSLPINNSCDIVEDDDVWFSFVATQTSHYIQIFNIDGTYFYLQNSLWKGDSNDLVMMPNTCSNGYPSLVSNLLIGATYYIRVYSYTEIMGQDTTFRISVSNGIFSPPNNECVNSISLINGATFETNPIIGTTLNSTKSFFAGLECGNYFFSNGDVWYKAIIPESGNLTIETRSVLGSNITDTAIATFTGDCNNLNLVNCNDDISNTNLFSKIQLTGQNPGAYIYIIVWKPDFYINNVKGEFYISAYDESYFATSEFDISQLKYAPNPVSNNFSISYKDTIDKVELFNVLGQKVLESSFNSNEIKLDLSKLIPSTYFVKVYSNNHSRTVTIIKS